MHRMGWSQLQGKKKNISYKEEEEDEDQSYDGAHYINRLLKNEL